jgi:hypothetical protein
MRVAIAAHVVVPLAYLQRRLGMAVAGMASSLATKVLACVDAEHLGYVPALEYFANRDGMDADLFNLAVRAADVACEYVARETQDRLWPLFSNLHIENMHAHAFTLPRINLRQPDRQRDLARHYAPTDIRLELVTSNLERGPQAPGFERFASQKVVRGLRESFDEITISSATLIEDK